MARKIAPIKIMQLGRTKPDYTIDINDLAEINSLEAEKEMVRRDYAEGRIKTHPSIAFSLLYNQREARKDNIFYLKNIGALKGLDIRNEMNGTYIRHLSVIENYEKMRKEIGNAPECRKRHPDLWKEYRISKICVDRYRRFLKGRWTVPSRKGKMLRCLSCGKVLFKGEKLFMCIKCENNQSERFNNRGKWKTDIMREEILKFPETMSFEERRFHIKKSFRRRITTIRIARKKEYLHNRYLTKIKSANAPNRT